MVRKRISPTFFLVLLCLLFSPKVQAQIIQEDFSTDPQWPQVYVVGNIDWTYNAGGWIDLVAPAGGANYSTWYYTQVELEECQAYTAQLDYQRTPLNNTPARIVIAIGNTPPQGTAWGFELLNQPFPANTGATTWTTLQATAVFTAPSTGTYYFAVRGSETSGTQTPRTMSFDNIVLEETTGGSCPCNDCSLADCNVSPTIYNSSSEALASNTGCTSGEVRSPAGASETFCSTFTTPSSPDFMALRFLHVLTFNPAACANSIATRKVYIDCEEIPSAGFDLDGGEYWILPANTTVEVCITRNTSGCTSVSLPCLRPFFANIPICEANAGTLNVGELCPGSTLTLSASGAQTGPGYSQNYFLTDLSGNILSSSPSGQFTVPNECGTYQVHSYNYLTSSPLVVTNPTSIDDILCSPQPICCDLSTTTFEVTTTVVMPPDEFQTVSCPSEIPSNPVPPQIENSCGGSLQIINFSGSDPQDCSGEVQFTWVFLESCTNTNYTWNLTYSLAEPFVEMPDDQEIELSCLGELVLPNPPALTDNCGNALTVQGPSEQGNPGCEGGVKEYIWTYEDCLNNSYSWKYIVNLQASEIVDFPADVESFVACLSEIELPQAPQVFDLCGEEVLPSGPQVDPDPLCAGIKNYIWEYQDCSGVILSWTFSYVIGEQGISNFPPNAQGSAACLDDIEIPLPPVVLDDCGNEIIPSGPVEGPDPLCGGTKWFDWTYTDCLGLGYDWRYEVVLEDPVLSLICPEEQTFCESSSGIYNIPPVLFSGSCGQNTSLSYVLSGATQRSGTGPDASGIFLPGLTLLEWFLSDECGNSLVCTTSVEILPKLEFEMISIECSEDLESYSVQFTHNASTLEVSIGELLGDQVINIPIEFSLVITFIQGDCIEQVTINPPNCDCPPLARPQINPGIVEICQGDEFPMFFAIVPVGVTVDWYDAASGGNLLLQGSLEFQAPGAGTFYAETLDPLTGCKSATRTPVTVLVKELVLPEFEAIANICQGQSFVLPPISMNNISGTWSPSISLLETTTYTFTPDSTQHSCVLATTLRVEVDEQPTLSVLSVDCAPDLETYRVLVSFSGGDLSFTAGELMGNAITGIGSGQNVWIAVVNPNNPDCRAETEVKGPNCDCPEVALPMVSPQEAEICEGEPFQGFTAQVGPGLTVNWYDAPVGGNLLLADQLFFQPPGPGVYYAETMDTETLCTSDTRISVELRILPSEKPVFTPIDPLCLGETFELPATDNSGISGSWSPQPNFTQSTTYVFTPTAQGGRCFEEGELSVTIHPLPSIHAGGDKILDCGVEEWIIEAQILSQGDYSLLWTSSDGILQEPSEINPLVTQSGLYSLVVTDNATGCTARDSARIVFTQGIGEVGVKVDPILCFGQQNGQIELLLGSGDKNIVFNGNPTQQRIFSNLAAGSYTISVSIDENCFWDTTLVLVNPQPIALSGLVDITLDKPQRTRLSVQVSAQQAYEILWFFANSEPYDCENEDCSEVSVMIDRSQEVRVLVIDELGCEKSMTIRIVLKEKNSVFVPNVFTPNGDGRNDLIYVFSDGSVPLIERFMIFDRWGELVFVAGNFPPNSPQFGWDGTLNNQEMNPQVFVYSLTYKDALGNVVQRSGDFTLLR
jgi:gliding motility-associated-like protein